MKDLFAFRSLKAAKVSEISEATAASNLPAEERINFHIGNPVQDTRLNTAYLRILLGLDFSVDEGLIFDAEEIREVLNLEADALELIEFLHLTVQSSSPYMPRGGFSPKSPVPAIQRFYDWLTGGFPESLDYNLGDQSGNRECVLSSGGSLETLRILFQTLSSTLVADQSIIIGAGEKIPEYLQNFRNLTFFHAELSLDTFQEAIESVIDENIPAFLVLFSIPEERIRRQIRSLCLEHDLYVIEVNDAPNHQSLAREAKLRDRVLRVLSCGILSENFSEIAVSCVAGDAEFLRNFETMHFKLKGTPGAAEVELLQFLLKDAKPQSQDVKYPNPDPDQQIGYPVSEKGDGSLSRSIQNVKRIESVSLQIFEKVSGKLSDRSDRITEIVSNAVDLGSGHFQAGDSFQSLSCIALVHKFLSALENLEFHQELIGNFEKVFSRVHPEYKAADLITVSGSSRTALGLLGMNCGIQEVITCDLGWTYEHCFPQVTVTSLTDNYDLNITEIKNTVSARIENSPDWIQHGAVILNNPHNASGRVFDEADLMDLTGWLLNRDVYLIDDLAYQNVLAGDHPGPVKTLKQLALELNRTGVISKQQLSRLISVHSLSKTDSFAGARLGLVDLADPHLREVFLKHVKGIKPNSMAILLAYLFYRAEKKLIHQYWGMRNGIFRQRMTAMIQGIQQLPADRNPFNIKITKPDGAMYPHMVITDLPGGLSLDWLSSCLAIEGVGLIPLSTFSRTAQGYELGRKSFRLTLGGTDSAETLKVKVRRIVIDLNRRITEEASRYTVHRLKDVRPGRTVSGATNDNPAKWKVFSDQVRQQSQNLVLQELKKLPSGVDKSGILDEFQNHYIKHRLDTLNQRFSDRAGNLETALQRYRMGNRKTLIASLEYEFYKDDLLSRQQKFRERNFDRTVHPTQVFALEVDTIMDRVIQAMLYNKPVQGVENRLAQALVKEYFGQNVAIAAAQESTELICDLQTYIQAELYSELNHGSRSQAFLSFWGDWDGSSRPSGQGHRLVAGALLENIQQLASIVNAISRAGGKVNISPDLLKEISALNINIPAFWKLLNQIETLTHQLEKRYRGLLPIAVKPGWMRKAGMKFGVAKDPVMKLWQHNDILERRMNSLRLKRRYQLEYFFGLNKVLRKTAFSLLPMIQDSMWNQDLLTHLCLYKDILKRFVLTPRIHQKLITSRDPFAIDTTVQNIHEINAISGKYGNPGMVLGLQVSMSTEPSALIQLDKKLNARREKVMKSASGVDLPKVWSIPLLEDVETVQAVGTYLDQIWDYSGHSKKINQQQINRFQEIVCEVFIAGSDLSQQVGQAASSLAYKNAKYDVYHWLANKDLTGRVRIKLGCGEPMQRQGGYYSPISGQDTFIQNSVRHVGVKTILSPATIKSTEFALSPLHGIHGIRDLVTVQSNLAEKLRQLSVKDCAQLLNHIRQSQESYRQEIVRATEPLINTRLKTAKKSINELEVLTRGSINKSMEAFSNLAHGNFRRILYGNQEDVVGIHVLSYFVSRTTPTLRDRPTVRPAKDSGDNLSHAVLERIASTIPLAKHGSLLRAIGHNRAQTVVLGLNQLTTGLFRSMKEFVQGADTAITGKGPLMDSVLPNLPVYEILHTLRNYQVKDLESISEFLEVFPSGNGALSALREDVASVQEFIPCLQRELLRRQGVSVLEFFEEDYFHQELLPTLRPDLAVVFQADLFNSDPEVLMRNIKQDADPVWREQCFKFLAIPEEVGRMRLKIWGLLKRPVKQQAKSFIELAMALDSLSAQNKLPSLGAGLKPRSNQLMKNLVSDSGDETMRDFLAAAVEYLSALPEENMEVPLDVIRALKEVEVILQIEQQALNAEEQSLLNFYLLRIARLTGENG